MIRREDAQSEFDAGGGVGRVGGRQFQVGGVLLHKKVRPHEIGVRANPTWARVWIDGEIPHRPLG